MSKVLDLAGRPVEALDSLGEQMRFYIRSLAWSPRTLRRYKKEVMRLLAEVSLGSGALSVIGGTVGVIAFLAFFTGSQVGLQGYSSLNQLGTGAFTGFVSAYLNTREIAPARGRAGPRGHGRAVASPPSSARCGSPRRSTPSR